MKRKMFLGIAALAVAVVSGYNVYLSKPSTKGLSDLALANVEALADGSETGTAAGICYIEKSFSDHSGWKLFCDSKTNDEMIFPCPSSERYSGYSEVMKDRCTK